MIPQSAEYLTPQQDYPDYGLKAYEIYKIKNNEGVGRYIEVEFNFFHRENLYIDNHEIREDVLKDFIIT